MSSLGLDWTACLGFLLPGAANTLSHNSQSHGRACSHLSQTPINILTLTLLLLLEVMEVVEVVEEEVEVVVTSDVVPGRHWTGCC